MNQSMVTVEIQYYMMDQLQDKTVSEERWLTYVSVKETVFKYG